MLEKPIFSYRPKKAAGCGTVHIQHAHGFSIPKDGDDDFRIGPTVTGDLYSPFPFGACRKIRPVPGTHLALFWIPWEECFAKTFRKDHSHFRIRILSARHKRIIQYHTAFGYPFCGQNGSDRPTKMCAHCILICDTIAWNKGGCPYGHKRNRANT